MGVEIKQTDTTCHQTKASAPGMNYLFLEWVGTEVQTPLILLVIPLPYFQELHVKILILNIPYAWGIEHGTIKRLLTWKLHTYRVAFMVLDIMHTIRGKKNQPPNTVSYNNDCPSKICLLMQQWHECYENIQILPDCN